MHYGEVEITLDGAGEGNRTPASGLGSRRSTIELHPHFMVGKTGFEPATPTSRTWCSTKLSHFPKKFSPLESKNPTPKRSEIDDNTLLIVPFLKAAYIIPAKK
jgi:hypothetical protein